MTVSSIRVEPVAVADVESGPVIVPRQAGGGVVYWAFHARDAALDRLAMPGRTIDPGFVAALDRDCREVSAQKGTDIAMALFYLHVGLYSAWCH